MKISREDKLLEPGVKCTRPGENVAFSPVADSGAIEESRVTLPVRPRLPSETVDVVEPPATRLMPELGLAAMEKSGRTVMSNWMVWLVCPKVPVTEIL